MYYHGELEQQRKKSWSTVSHWLWLIVHWWYWFGPEGMIVGPAKKVWTWYQHRCWQIEFAIADFPRKCVRWYGQLTNGGLSPWVKGPEYLHTEEFVEALQRLKPRMASYCVCTSTVSEWHLVAFYFRKGRMVYVTHIPFCVEKTGFLPDALPVPFRTLFTAGSYDRRHRSSIIRDPIKRLG